MGPTGPAGADGIQGPIGPTGPGVEGVTATAAELNILDGATVTTTELNYASGVTSPIQTQLNSKASLTYPVNNQTGTSYTLVAGDVAYFIELNNSAAITVTVPPNSSAAIAVGSTISIMQTGAGQVTVSPGAGVTLNYTPGNKLRAQWSSATLYKRGTDLWVLFGDTVA
jgi:hypothetical protein